MYKHLLVGLSLFTLLLGLPCFAALTGTLGTGLDATSNPDPNGLTEDTPYAVTAAYSGVPITPSSAWTTQDQPALFPLGSEDGRGDVAIKVHFVPSGGAAITYTIKIWMYNPVSDTWVQPKDGGSVSYTGEAVDYIENPGSDAIFLEIDTISAGTLSIYFDPANAQKG